MRLARITGRNIKTAMKIIRACFRGNYDRFYALKWYRKFIKNERGDNKSLGYYIAYDGKNPVGVTGFYSFKKGDFWLGWFGVTPGERRKGTGSLIVRETIKLSKKYGAKTFSAWGTVKKSESFYKKNGFKKIAGEKSIIVDGKLIYRYPRGAYFYRKRV